MIERIMRLTEILREWSPNPNVRRYVFITRLRPRHYGLQPDGKTIVDGRPQGRPLVLNIWGKP